ncbi:MAG: lytic transglycosylase domain-containing protein [Prevotellaceae bacterium]|jgi:hypothetical protein|nr:lytic transglycosylase domain-containing protein [Prevotellaceae bacterium]
MKIIFIRTLLLFLLLVSCANTTNNLSVPQQNEPPGFQQDIRTPNIPDKLNFAGEVVPLEYFDVAEPLIRELSIICYWHASTMYITKLSHRFFPIIEPILQREGIPNDFKYLCVAESGLQQVISPNKAVGFWQFLEATGKEYGLEINSEIDERYHIEKATVAACAYLKKAYEKYDSWTMAAAAYNMGMANADKQIGRQKQTSYYDLLLPDETMRYIFRILAFKTVMSNLETYGFFIRKDELFSPLQWTEATIDEPITSWADFAEKYNTNYKTLKYLNPWLRDAVLTNKVKKTYVIKIPTPGFRIKATDL